MVQPVAELVITAPQAYASSLAYHTRCRLTLGVLTQLMAEFRRHVVIAAPFFQVGYGVSRGPLADALRAALRRGVDVDVVSTGQALSALDTMWLRDKTVGQLRLFQPQANIENERRIGLHAKFCVSDDERAYVGSANLTGPGLSEHFEMGLLIRGEVAQQIGSFWRYVVQIGSFVLLSSEFYGRLKHIS